MVKRKPLKEFKKRSKNRQQLISQSLFLPNLLDEFSKSKTMVVVFFVLMYFTYRDWKSFENKLKNVPEKNLPYTEDLPKSDFLSHLQYYNTYKSIKQDLEIKIRLQNKILKDDNKNVYETNNEDIKEAEHDLNYIDTIFFDSERRLETKKDLNHTAKTHLREEATKEKKSNGVIYDVFPGLKILYEKSLAKIEERKRAREKEKDTPVTLRDKRILLSVESSISINEADLLNTNKILAFLYLELNYTFITFIIAIVIVSFILISFGNASQFDCHWGMILAFILILFNLGILSFLFRIGIVSLNIMIVSIVFCVVSTFSIFSLNNFSPTSLVFSSFNENRDYIYSEYTYQKLFGHVSIYWGMRFGLYQSFDRYFKVKQSLKPPKFYERNHKKVTIKNGLETEVKIIVTPEISKEKVPEALEQVKIENEERSNLNTNGISELNTELIKDNEEDIIISNWSDTFRDHRKTYEKIYAFYELNEIEHSYVIKRKDRLTVNASPYKLGKRKLKNRLWKLVRPFSMYKRHLIINNPFYMPSRLLIVLLIQIVIQIEFLNILINLFHNTRIRNFFIIDMVSSFLEISAKDFYTAASISAMIIILFYIVLILVSNTEFLLNFETTLVRFRLKGLDITTKKISTWGAVNFIKQAIGSIFFSNGPIIFIFFTILTCLFSINFWKFVWYVRMSWLPIIVLIIVERIFDFAARRITGDGRYFRLRICIQFVDTIKLYAGFYSGLFYGITRFTVGILLVNITMLRIDKTGVPSWVSKIKNLDSGNKKYIAMVKMYHCSNNPIVFAFMGIVADHISKLRAKKERQDKKEQILETSEDHEINNLQIENGQKDNRSWKMSEQKRKTFLKIAYKWQRAVYLIRNPLLIKYKQS